LQSIHTGLAAGFVVVGHQEVCEDAVAAEFVDTVGSKVGDVTNNVQGVDLELNKLRLGPAAEDHVLLARLGVQEH